METKICSKCKIEKPIEMFYLSDRIKRKARCKECKNTTQKEYIERNKDKVAKCKKEWYEKTREERNEYRRKYSRENRKKINQLIEIGQARLRQQIIAGYGGKCECCGESKSVFLDIDHINNNGKIDRARFNSSRSFYRWLRDNGFPRDGYQLLCSNCNQGKRRNHGICPHREKKVSV